MIASDFPDFDPQTIASQGNAILGIRDSGKSYTAILIAERFHNAGIPFIGFDPVGRWRFIRVPGRGPGLPVVIAGGAAGDLPLTVETAPKIVRAAMESGVSLVLDLYDIEVSKADWKRIVGDSVRVLLYENGAHGLRHIFIEEAAEFAPQRVGPDQGRVYAEIEKLARMGGNARLGYTLINQRAEEVNKAVLELCDNLFLHRQKGRHSLNALSKWLDIADVKPGSRDIIKSLPTLPQGECWFWRAGTDRPVHVKVPPKNSFEPDRRLMRDTGGMVPGKVSRPVSVADFLEDLRGRLAGDVPAAVSPATFQRIPKIAPRRNTAAAIASHSGQFEQFVAGGRAAQAAVNDLTKPKGDKDVKESEARALRAENARLTDELAVARAKLNTRGMLNLINAPDAPAIAPSIDELYSEIKRRAQADPAVLVLLAQKPSITVEIERPTIETTDATLPGRLAGLIAGGFFAQSATGSAAFDELKRRGFATSKPSVYNACDKLTLQGFLIKTANGYQAIEGMLVNIVEKGKRSK